MVVAERYERKLTRENVVNIKSLLKTGVSAVALAAAVAVPAHAEVFQDFTVTYGGHTVTADKLNGGYSEIFTLGAGNTFKTSAYATLGQFFKNEGLDFVDFTEGYRLYATFTATGNILDGGATFQGTTGKIALFLDPLKNTTLGLPGVGGAPINVGNVDDDIPLASTSTFQFGSGHTFPGNSQNANGDYSLTFTDFLLTSAGKDYFIAPVPFYLQLTIDGNFTNFPPPDANGNSVFNGGANVSFIPEPSMVGLFGIALLGLGLSRRRQRK
jgi:hypothetical protein